MKKEIDSTTVKDIRSLFRLKKENEAIKDRIIRDIRYLFEHEEEDYCKPVRVGNFWSNTYIEYESNEIEINPYQWKYILIKLYHS